MNRATDRSAEAWSVDNHPRKYAIESSFVRNMIGHLRLGDKDRRLLLERGLDIYTLTGPALNRHFKTYSSLLGLSGRMVVPEIDERVQSVQKDQLSLLSRKQRERIVLFPGDWFDAVDKLMVERKHPYRAKYFDYDATNHFNLDNKDEYFKRFSGILSRVDVHSRLVEITLTHSYRSGNKGIDQYRRMIECSIQNWANQINETSDWHCSRFDFMSYRDNSAPMWTCNLRFEMPMNELYGRRAR